MKRVKPNGKRIAELRQQLGKKQAQLALDAGLSERKMRNIETKNDSVEETLLRNIATQLNAKMEDITFFHDIREQEEANIIIGPFSLRLTKLNSGSKFISYISNCVTFEW